MGDLFHVIYLTGAPATGKSTLASLLLQSVEPLERVSYSEILSSTLSISGCECKRICQAIKKRLRNCHHLRVAR
jgi:adenylate kinase family enzyme